MTLIGFDAGRHGVKRLFSGGSAVTLGSSSSIISKNNRLTDASLTGLEHGGEEGKEGSEKPTTREVGGNEDPST